MELPITQCRSSLQGCVDLLLTVGTARRVPRVGNTEDRYKAAARQHWTGVKPLKHKLSSLLSDITFTSNGALQQVVCFDLIQFMYDSNHSIVLMQSP